jgi:glutathione S-transferase
MIELYHGEPNMHALKPLVALHEKGLPFTSRFVDYAKFEHARLFQDVFEVRQNPEGEGPVLVDHGVPMTESAFITLYIDEAYPGKPLRSQDAENRWRVLMWARFLNEVTAPAVGTLGCQKFLAQELKARDRLEMEKDIAALPSKEQQDGWRAALYNSYSEDQLADCRRKAEMSVKKVEAALESSDWLAGPDFSIADIDAFALLRPLAKNFPELLNDKNAPNTVRWLGRIEGRPSVKAALATSKTGKPETSFTPGSEHSRWG